MLTADASGLLLDLTRAFLYLRVMMHPEESIGLWQENNFVIRTSAGTDATGSQPRLVSPASVMQARDMTTLVLAAGCSGADVYAGLSQLHKLKASSSLLLASYTA